MLDQEAELGNNNNNSLLWPPGQFPSDDTSSLDYLLALSLDDMDGQEGVWTDVWDHQFGRTPDHSSSQIQANNNYCNSAASRTTASHSPSGQGLWQHSRVFFPPLIFSPFLPQYHSGYRFCIKFNHWSSLTNDTNHDHRITDHWMWFLTLLSTSPHLSKVVENHIDSRGSQEETTYLPLLLQLTHLASFIKYFLKFILEVPCKNLVWWKQIYLKTAYVGFGNKYLRKNGWPIRPILWCLLIFSAFATTTTSVSSTLFLFCCWLDAPLFGGVEIAVLREAKPYLSETKWGWHGQTN